MKLLLVNLVLTIDSMGLNEREQGNPFEWAVTGATLGTGEKAST
jgi:hypothetical protein